MSTQLTSASGAITTAYSLKPSPTCSAKMRFIGFDVTSGAMPAAVKIANANGTTNFG